MISNTIDDSSPLYILAVLLACNFEEYIEALVKVYFTQKYVRHEPCH